MPDNFRHPIRSRDDRALVPFLTAGASTQRSLKRGIGEGGYLRLNGAGSRPLSMSHGGQSLRSVRCLQLVEAHGAWPRLPPELREQAAISMEDALPTEFADDYRHTRTALITAIASIKAAIDMAESSLPS